jgi:hypothetical protein
MITAYTTKCDCFLARKQNKLRNGSGAVWKKLHLLPVFPFFPFVKMKRLGLYTFYLSLSIILNVYVVCLFVFCTCPPFSVVQQRNGAILFLAPSLFFYQTSTLYTRYLYFASLAETLLFSYSFLASFVCAWHSRFWVYEYNPIRVRTYCNQYRYTH